MARHRPPGAQKRSHSPRASRPPRPDLHSKPDSHKRRRTTRNEDGSDSSSEDGFGAFIDAQDHESNSDFIARSHEFESDASSDFKPPRERSEEQRMRAAAQRVQDRAAAGPEQPGSHRRSGQSSRNENRPEMDGHGHLGRLPGFENAEGATAFSDTEYDEPTAPRGYKGPGIGARGAGHGNGCRGGFTAGGHGDGGIRARPGDENDGDDEGPSKPRGFHRRRTRRFAPGKRER